jgi:hypothetical protein
MSDGHQRAGSRAVRDVLIKRSRAVTMAVEEAAAAYSHSGVKGEAIEAILRDELLRLLPARFGIASGQIQDATGGPPSAEVDLAIFDRLSTPRLHAEGRRRLLPVEGVIAVVSVKKTLTPAAIREAFALAGRLQRMPRFTTQGDSAVNAPLSPDAPTRGLERPAVFLYGFAGPSTESIHATVNGELTEREPRPHGVGVHGKAYFFPVAGLERVPVREVTHMTHYSHMADGDGSFGHFAAHVHSILVSTPSVPVNLSAYVRPSLLAQAATGLIDE